LGACNIGLGGQEKRQLKKKKLTTTGRWRQFTRQKNFFPGTALARREGGGCGRRGSRKGGGGDRGERRLVLVGRTLVWGGNGAKGERQKNRLGLKTRKGGGGVGKGGANKREDRP